MPTENNSFVCGLVSMIMALVALLTQGMALFWSFIVVAAAAWTNTNMGYAYRLYFSQPTMRIVLWFGLLLGITAIILASVAFVRKERKINFAVTGMIVGILMTAVIAGEMIWSRF